jgi:putative addiction module CopG family antidote
MLNWAFVAQNRLARRHLLAYLSQMAFALAKEQEEFIGRMVSKGRFSNQSEVVREALRRMEREESSYLNPDPLTPEEAERIYAANPEEDAREVAMASAAMRSIRNSRRKK